MKETEDTSNGSTSVSKQGISAGNENNEIIKELAHERNQAQQTKSNEIKAQQTSLVDSQPTATNRVPSTKGKIHRCLIEPISKAIDNCEPKISCDLSDKLSAQLGSRYVDVKVDLPLRSNKDRIQSPEPLVIKLATPIQQQLILPVESPTPYQLVPPLLKSLELRIAGALLSALLVVSSSTREKIVLGAVNLPLYLIGYTFARKRSVKPGFKTFSIKESENKERGEVVITIVQATMSLLRNEKRRGSVMIFNLPHGSVERGSSGKITRVWKQNRFKFWREKKERQVYCEVAFNVDIPPSDKFQLVEDGPAWFFVPPNMVRRNQYDFKAIDRLMREGKL